MEAAFIIANIYAPNPNNADKIEFFNKIFDIVSEQMERFNCTNVLIAGDFNQILESKEAKNRLHTVQEKRIAEGVKERINLMQLKDCWEVNKSFTWRRPNSSIFSAIDRVLHSGESLSLKFSFSDHAAVVTSFKPADKKHLSRSKITRLDPSLATSPHFKMLTEQGVNSMIESAPPDWNPHLWLEFTKMCTRTVVENIQAERKRLETGEEIS